MPFKCTLIKILVYIALVEKQLITSVRYIFVNIHINSLLISAEVDGNVILKPKYCPN